MGKPGEREIPDKLVFRIGDVSRLTGVKPHVLRYWESEFPAIVPRKSSTGQRVYRRHHVELIFEIRDLLYDQRFTIEGAKKVIESRQKSPPDMDDIRRELREILDLLE